MCTIDIRETELLNSKQKVVMMQGVLKLLIKRDLSMTRRIYSWFFGEPDMENRYECQENDVIIQYVIEALHHLFQARPEKKKDCGFPLKILQNFFMDHEVLIEVILKGTSLELVKYIYTYGFLASETTESKELGEEVMKAGNRFIECITSYFGVLLETLISKITEEADKNLSDLVLL